MTSPVRSEPRNAVEWRPPHNTPRNTMQRWEWAAITLILLLATALRLWTLGQVPPGLAHDEVANWLIAHDILAGRHAIYFTAAYGHEPLYQYIQAATVALFGDHWLGLRYPSAALGLLGIAATYILIRRLFGAPTALLTGGWLAVSFWPLFYSRVALRAISLPFTAALSAYFILRAIRLTAPQYVGRASSPDNVERASSPDWEGAEKPNAAPRPKSANSTHERGGITAWLLAGLFLGLSLYTYMAARILPAILIPFLVYLFLVHPPVPFPWSRLSAFLLTAAIVSAPLVIWLATHPGAEFRITEVRQPLDKLLAGDPSMVWQNLVANLKFFTFTGDPWPRQNISGRPVFADPISAALFYGGVLIALWRWRDPRYGFLLIWLAGALVPSIVTSDAPSSIRNILGLVVVFTFPALVPIEAGRWITQQRRRPFQGRLPQPLRGRLLASCIILLVPCFLLTVRDYFIRWPQNDVVRFDYQADLTAVAHRLDELPPGTPATVAGLSMHTMDGPSLDLAARRDVSHVRLCDTRETLVIPALVRSGDGGETGPAGYDAWLFVPRVVPLDADLQARLLKWGATVSQTPSLDIGPGRASSPDVEQAPSPAASPSFTAYRLPGGADGAKIHHHLQNLQDTAALPDGTPVTLPISFGGGDVGSNVGQAPSPDAELAPSPSGQLAFLGYEQLPEPTAGQPQQTPTPGNSITLLTYWRVEIPPGVALKIFVHLTDEAGRLVAQSDGLGSPPRGWASGDLIVQRHAITIPADASAGPYIPLIGLYEVQDPARRLMVDPDSLAISRETPFDHLVLAALEVTPP